METEGDMDGGQTDTHGWMDTQMEGNMETDRQMDGRWAEGWTDRQTD